MTVKVNRGKLIAAIAAKRDEVIKAHAAAAKESEAGFLTYKRDVEVKVSDFLKNVKAAKSINTITRHLRYGRELLLPDAPVSPAAPKTAQYDKALAQLALVDDGVILLSEKKDASFLELI